MFVNKTAKFAPVWTIIIKIRAIFVHKSLTETCTFSFILHFVTKRLAISYFHCHQNDVKEFDRFWQFIQTSE